MQEGISTILVRIYRDHAIMEAWVSFHDSYSASLGQEQ